MPLCRFHAIGNLKDQTATAKLLAFKVSCLHLVIVQQQHYRTFQITRCDKMSTIQGFDLRFCSTLDKRGMLRPLARLRGSALRGRALAGALFICVSALNISVADAKQKPFHVMNIKLYAYNQMSWEQFQCYNYLIYEESRWNYLARNGSHYGLGQMRSKWYGTLSPIKQIDAHLDYIKHRYEGDACKAYAHWERKGWH